MGPMVPSHDQQQPSDDDDDDDDDDDVDDDDVKDAKHVHLKLNVTCPHDEFDPLMSLHIIKSVKSGP